MTYEGILHLSSDHVMSKYEFACEIAHILHFDKQYIQKAKLENANLFAPRPLNTTLANNKAKKILTTKQIQLDEWLKRQFLT